LCAGISIEAGSIDLLVLAATSRKTDILGAGVGIIAFQGTFAQAVTGGANVASSAGIAVIALHGICQMDAALLRMAGIVGAGVAIIAIHRGTGNATSQRTFVVSGALAIITTWVLVVGLGAAGHRQADIIGARIPVVAFQWLGTNTRASGAAIANRAGIGIVTLSGMGRVEAPYQGVASVICTSVPIITIQGRPAGTLTSFTGIIHGAEIIITARGRVELVKTTYCGGAAIVGARIGIIAPLDPRRHTEPGLALVASGTEIAVVTGTI